MQQTARSGVAMSKQQADARRAVTETDLQLVDRTIADHEVFQKDLFVLRRVLTEIGNLDARYAGMKQGIEAVQSEAARTNAQFEQVKTRRAAPDLSVAPPPCRLSK
jgi:hypothetical protein